MAAPTAGRRCLLVLAARRAVSLPRRTLLSAAYTDPARWEETRKPEPQSLVKLAKLMDGLHDSKLPVSSLSIARFVDNISSREEVDQAEYYLYKFRHSENSLCLREWTIHNWLRKCLQYGAKDKALYTIQNKVQYGIFPDPYGFNLLLDTYIKADDFKGAAQVAVEVMLQEAFDWTSTQLLALHALHGFLSGQPDVSWQEDRNIGAALLLAGQAQNTTAGYSSQLMGSAKIGKVELMKGLRAVFTRMPLIWTPGYLDRGIDIMDKVLQSPGAVQLTTDSVEAMAAVLEELEKLTEEGADAAQEEDADDKEGGRGDVQVPQPAQLEAEDAREAEERRRAVLPALRQRFQAARAELERSGRLSSRSAKDEVLAQAQELLPALERQEVAEFGEQVALWEKQREELALLEATAQERARERQLLEEKLQSIKFVPPKQQVL
ncbi:small ribosomal subunit protein mS27 [Petromyzon marinus]|uniref:Small ribosomal subunit protein mS27 n=1 Tax=Petromyzon marinus TaxID=7757 RepID=A0AAJ7SLP1_PETMA|nr:28S ribosomal protein S27, mitochondrial [Petromyzon marinus]